MKNPFSSKELKLTILLVTGQKFFSIGHIKDQLLVHFYFNIFSCDLFLFFSRTDIASDTYNNTPFTMIKSTTKGVWKVFYLVSK